MHLMNISKRCGQNLCALLILCSIAVNSAQAAPRYPHDDSTSGIFPYFGTSTATYEENRLTIAPEYGEQAAIEGTTSPTVSGEFDSIFYSQQTTSNPSIDEQATSASSARAARPTFAPYHSFVTMAPAEDARIILSPYERSLWDYRPGLDPIPDPASVNLDPANGSTPFPGNWEWMTTRRDSDSQPPGGMWLFRPNNQRYPEEPRTNLSDYVDSEEDFQRLLDRLHSEAEAERIGDNRNNYVNDDEDIESIWRRISEQEQNATVTIPINFQPMTSPAPRTTPNIQSQTLSTDNNQEDQEEEEICSICLEPIDYSNGVSLDCGHNFHMNCISRWLKQARAEAPKCPVCRQPVRA